MNQNAQHETYERYETSAGLSTSFATFVKFNTVLCLQYQFPRRLTLFKKPWITKWNWNDIQWCSAHHWFPGILHYGAPHCLLKIFLKICSITRCSSYTFITGKKCPLPSSTSSVHNSSYAGLLSLIILYVNLEFMFCFTSAYFNSRFICSLWEVGISCCCMWWSWKSTSWTWLHSVEILIKLDRSRWCHWLA